MNINIAVALLASGVGAFIFFKAKGVRNHVLLSLGIIILLGGSFLYDNSAYMFDYCRRPDSYVESTSTMMYRGSFQHHHRHAYVSYYEDEETQWSAVPVAFYEELPKKITIKVRSDESAYAKVTRDQIVISAETLIVASIGVWIMLACIVRPTTRE